MTALPIIETDALTRRYGRRRGIESVNLAVPEGSLYGFLGPNGAGKTTTIRVLLGLLAPTRGAARILGLDCWRNSREIKAAIGYLPGDLRLYGWMNGRQALGIVSKVRRQNLMRHGTELANEFDLDLGVKVRKMSRGMRQKLGLILALAHRPRVLILDEPTVSLDPLMQDKLHERLRRMSAEGHTVFFSSHTLNEVDSLCDRVGIIRNGSLIRDESLESLRRHAGHRVTIRWANPSSARPTSPPPFFDLQECKPEVWTGTLTGSVNELVGWLAGYAIDDLAIGPPELETLFRRFYDDESPDKQ